MNARNIYRTIIADVEVKPIEVLSECTLTELTALFKEFFSDEEMIELVSADALLSYVRGHYRREEVFPEENE